MASETDVQIPIVVIGAGAAGMIAATEAARRSRTAVLLLEKNTKAGVKILMSGGTRCNLTQDTDARGITEAFGHARRFLQPAVGAFPPAAVIRMFGDLGVATKREPTGKIFPQSDRAVEVRDALQRDAIRAGVDLRLSCGVETVRRDGEAWRISTARGELWCKHLIVTAGGRSWPGCGTTGDAYAWLAELGHTIVPTAPALVPLVGGPNWMHELSGLTLDDTVITVHPGASPAVTPSDQKPADQQPAGEKRRAKPLLRRRASWLFTHFGYSGPAAMDVSRYVTTTPSPQDRPLTLDLLPEIDAARLEAELSRRDRDGGRRTVAAALAGHLPSRLATALARESGYEDTLAGLPAAHRRRLVALVKRLPIPVSGSRGFGKAEVTAGGVSLAEVDPKTMASRIVPNLTIAGEVLDVDGWIGGYNFQAAFSTGRLAAITAAAGVTGRTG